MKKNNELQLHDSGIVMDISEVGSQFKGPFKLSKACTILLYLLYIVLLFIGLAGVSVSCYYLQPSFSFTQTDATYKWIGLGIGGLLVIIATILLCIFGFDHACNSSWLSGKNVIALYNRVAAKQLPAQGVNASIGLNIEDNNDKNKLILKNGKTKSSKTRSIKVASKTKSKIPKYEDFSEDELTDDDVLSQSPNIIKKEIHHHHYFTPSNEDQIRDKASESFVLKVESEKNSDKEVLEALQRLFKNKSATTLKVNEESSSKRLQAPVRRLTARVITPLEQGQLPPIIPTRGGSWILVNPTVQITSSNKPIILSARSLISRPRVASVLKLEKHVEEVQEKLDENKNEPDKKENVEIKKLQDQL